uniref:Uncharacterized protein n=1 Tax=Strigamia maritima TaxID=126957 RepID=T1JA29_STRMM
MKYQLVIIAFFCLGLSLSASAADTENNQETMCAAADGLAKNAKNIVPKKNNSNVLCCTLKKLHLSIISVLG